MILSFDKESISKLDRIEMHVVVKKKGHQNGGPLIEISIDEFTRVNSLISHENQYLYASDL